MKNFKILVWFDSPQVNWYMKSSSKIVVYELHHELSNDLRLRILANSKNMRKTRKWVEAERITQSLFEKEKWY